jgi:hypothetical protein
MLHSVYVPLVPPLVPQPVHLPVNVREFEQYRQVSTDRSVLLCVWVAPYTSACSSGQ